MSHHTKKFFSVNPQKGQKFFNLEIPVGAVTGRMTVTYHGKKEEVVYCLTDFRPYFNNNTSVNFNFYVVNQHGNWIKSNTARRAPWRQVAQMLYCNLGKRDMLYNNVGETSLDKLERERDLNRVIRANCPHDRRIGQYI